MIMIGATSDLEIIWQMADLFMGSMAVVNLIAVALLAHIAVRALKDFQDQQKSGIDPIFYRDSIKGVKHAKSRESKVKQQQ